MNIANAFAADVRDAVNDEDRAAVSGRSAEMTAADVAFALGGATGAGYLQRARENQDCLEA